MAGTARMSVSLLLSLIFVLSSAAPPALAATPAPSPSHTPCACSIDLTGHWASPVEASGIDIVQTGTAVSGHSLSDVSFTGTISGFQVTFTFWRGASYAKATDENRGTGSIAVSADGNSANVTWSSKDGKGQFNGQFVIVKVGPPADSGVSANNMFGDLLSGAQQAIQDYLPSAKPPQPGASPLATGQLDAMIGNLPSQAQAEVLGLMNALTPGQPAITKPLNGLIGGSSAGTPQNQNEAFDLWLQQIITTLEGRYPDPPIYDPYPHA
jgi:hypothetical protein